MHALDGSGKQRRAGGEGVPELADVPLDAAGEPRVADGQVGGLENRVAVEQLTLQRLIYQGDQPRAHLRQEGGLEELVLQHHGGEVQRLAGAGIGILHAVGQHAKGSLPAQVGLLFGGQGGVNLARRVDRRVAEEGQRVFLPQARAGEGVGFNAQ